MSLQPKPQLQFADWLAAERASDRGRTEFLDGEAGRHGCCRGLIPSTQDPQPSARRPCGPHRR
jgi:hypothetical protein